MVQLSEYRLGVRQTLTQGGRELVQAVQLGRTPAIGADGRIDEPFGW